MFLTMEFDIPLKFSLSCTQTTFLSLETKPAGPDSQETVLFNQQKMT